MTARSPPDAATSRRGGIADGTQSGLPGNRRGDGLGFLSAWLIAGDCECLARIDREFEDLGGHLIVGASAITGVARAWRSEERGECLKTFLSRGRHADVARAPNSDSDAASSARRAGSLRSVEASMSTRSAPSPIAVARRFARSCATDASGPWNRKRRQSGDGRSTAARASRALAFTASCWWRAGWRPT